MTLMGTVQSHDDVDFQKSPKVKLNDRKLSKFGSHMVNPAESDMKERENEDKSSSFMSESLSSKNELLLSSDEKGKVSKKDQQKKKTEESIIFSE